MWQPSGGVRRFLRDGEDLRAEYIKLRRESRYLHYPEWKKNTKESAHRLLFEPCGCKDGLTFLERDYSMTYYRDFPESNIRLVVLDMYFDIDIQCAWLRDILRDARRGCALLRLCMSAPTL